MARIAAAVIALTLAGVSLAAAPEPRAVTPDCSDAKAAVADAKQKVKKAKQALEDAETPRAKERAKKKLKKAKDLLRDAKAEAARLCAVRFVVIGAQGKGNTGQSDVAAAIDAKCEADGCGYVIGLGNNIYDSGASSTSDPGFADMFETPYANIDLPFWLGLGNHDYGNEGGTPEAATAQVQVDYTAVSPSGKWEMPAKYYRRTDGPVEFFTLDTTMQMWGQDAQQETDVSGWVSNSTADWKIALGLHGYRSNGPHGNAGEYEGIPGIPIASGDGVKDFMEDHICGEADVYFSAHDHSLQWPERDTVNCPGTELIVSGAAASTTKFEGDNPTNFQSLALGFVYVVIEGDKMTIDFVDKDGTVLYSDSITK